MKDILIPTANPYHVLVGPGLLDAAGEALRSLSPRPGTLMIVTDTNVAPLYLERLTAALVGFDVRTCAVEAGEAHKNPETLLTVLRTMAAAELTRSDLVLALGGGVVGDMAGFASAVYQRGMRFVQLPTTLLSAVDASVGGKTAVDLPEGKNLIGAFHQPSLVLCDTDTFDTLPDLRWADGAAEMVKHGMIADSGLFGLMEAGAWRRDVPGAVARNVEIKRGFVVGDERDQGQRQLLNFGHTIGHAVEAWSRFTLSHGQAVAIGMVMETRAARILGLSEVREDRLAAALRANGLPTGTDAPADRLLAFALRDKKRRTDSVTVAVPVSYGQARLVRLGLDELARFIEAGGAA